MMDSIAMFNWSQPALHSKATVIEYLEQHQLQPALAAALNSIFSSPELPTAPKEAIADMLSACPIPKAELLASVERTKQRNLQLGKELESAKSAVAALKIQLAVAKKAAIRRP